MKHATPAASVEPVGVESTTMRIVAGFVFVGDRLWLDFVNTEADAGTAPSGDVLRGFDALVGWLQAADVLDVERAQGMR
ncbi:MAG: ABATE domain-containing protein, partial [Gemmatimonadaceae bacterium]|nr:ABATE domain-containing protein [Gemmatimonadaceae bacterium]